ncbi:hypothetical protein D8M04_18855 [Oceanobacillus piezotolerans]|uniref:Uncharacterized protein n=1 Tax=Oceanobacillus piezotolerans TaxID=2448030 RepID=A0A498DHT9_9BACI|nr:hypothetical protein [Oceanobacillus piezotolerans]RLL40606.1 hypothetical protein D8M04_18855 [Oceanobacillus piezotolerans]
MDNSHKEVDSTQGTEEGKILSSVNRTSDEEWKEFIKQELNKVENQENQANEESSANSKLSLSTLIEKIPVEDVIKFGVKIVKNQVQGKNQGTKRSKKRSKNRRKKRREKKR